MKEIQSLLLTSDSVFNLHFPKGNFRNPICTFETFRNIVAIYITQETIICDNRDHCWLTKHCKSDLKLYQLSTQKRNANCKCRLNERILVEVLKLLINIKRFSKNQKNMILCIFMIGRFLQRNFSY